MVREPERRRRKYEAKVDAEVLRRQTQALKPGMVEGQAKYFPEIATVEVQVKRLVEAQGETTLTLRDYINFGREMYELSRKFSGATLAAEAQLKVNKWGDRGLKGDLLVKIAGFFGVKPSAPPAPPTILYLGDLEDVEISAPSDGQVLTYEEISALWKNKTIPLFDYSHGRFLRSGRYHCSPWGQGVTAVMTANYLWASPFLNTIPRTITRMAIHIITAKTGNIRLGVHNDDGDCYPNDLIQDAGTVSSGTTGIKQITGLNIPLLKDSLYWLVGVSNAGPSVKGYYLGWGPVGWPLDSLDYTSPFGGYMVPFTYGPLPSKYPAGATPQQTLARIAVCF